jgi:hypothetical protein
VMPICEGVWRSMCLLLNERDKEILLLNEWDKEIEERDGEGEKGNKPKE